MAESVIVNIPGIGDVEAKNAATESTLRELVNLMKGKGGAGGAGSGSSSGAAADKVMGPGSPLGKASKNQAGVLNKLGNMAGKAAGSIMKIGGAALAGATAFVKVGEAAASVISNISKLDNNVTAAANSIPLLGGVFGKVAEASERMVNAVQQASSSGASFGGQIQNLTNAAATAGMTIDQYTKFVQTNGEAFRLLGGSVEAGRKRFEILSKEMRTSGMMQQLNTLGYTSEQVNIGMARYSRIVGQTGKLQNMSTTQLAQRSANYMKEIDKLAKATGQEREQIEENQAKLLRDAQFQAAVARLGVDEADALRNTITGLPEGLQGVAKDIISTGTATTKESEEFAALMPRSAAMMQRFAQITEQGGMITTAMQQELQNTMRAEGQERKIQYQDQGRYNADLADSYMRIVDASNIQQDALVNATDAQNQQTAASDGAVAGMEAMRRRINEVSIEFTNFLQSSGLMDSFMKAFELLTSVIRTVVFPVFELFGIILKPVVAVISAVVMPPLKMLGFVLDTVVMPPLRMIGEVISTVSKVFEHLYTHYLLNLQKAFNEVVFRVQSFLQPALDFFGRMINGVAGFFQDNLVPAISSVGDILGWIWDKFKMVGDFLGDILQPIFDALGTVLTPVVNAFKSVYDAVTNFFDSFRTLSDVFTSLGLQVDLLKLGFRAMMLDLADAISWIPGLGRDAEEEAEAAQERRQLEADMMDYLVRRREHDEKLADNVEVSQSERELADFERLQAHEARQADLDAQIERNANAAWETIRNTGSNATREAINDQFDQINEAQDELNLMDPTALLQGFARQQNSFLVPDEAGTPTTPGSNVGPATNTSALTTPTDTATGGSGGSNASGSGNAAPVAAAGNEGTNPVAALNSNIEELLNLTRTQIRLQREEILATKALSNDAFSM